VKEEEHQQDVQSWTAPCALPNQCKRHKTMSWRMTNATDSRIEQVTDDLRG